MSAISSALEGLFGKCEAVNFELCTGRREADRNKSEADTSDQVPPKDKDAAETTSVMECLVPCDTGELVEIQLPLTSVAEPPPLQKDVEIQNPKRMRDTSLPQYKVEDLKPSSWETYVNDPHRAKFIGRPSYTEYRSQFLIKQPSSIKSPHSNVFGKKKIEVFQGGSNSVLNDVVQTISHALVALPQCLHQSFYPKGCLWEAEVFKKESEATSYKLYIRVCEVAICQPELHRAIPVKRRNSLSRGFSSKKSTELPAPRVFQEFVIAMHLLGNIEEVESLFVEVTSPIKTALIMSELPNYLSGPDVNAASLSNSSSNGSFSFDEKYSIIAEVCQKFLLLC